MSIILVIPKYDDLHTYPNRLRRKGSGGLTMVRYLK